MSEDLGWVSIHRQIKKQFWYTKPFVVQLFVHLLLSCNRSKGYKVQFFGEEKELDSGQYWTTLKRLCAETGISVQSIRTALTQLLTTRTITNEKDPQGHIITILNWDKFQSTTRVVTRNQQRSNKGLTKGQHHNNNIISEHIEQGDKISPNGSAQKSAQTQTNFESFWLKYPKKRDKVRCLKTWNARRLDTKFDAIMSGLEVELKSTQWAKDQGEFIPHPSTWLNNERWESANIAIEIKPIDFLEQVRELRRREGKTT